MVTVAAIEEVGVAAIEAVFEATPDPIVGAVFEATPDPIVEAVFEATPDPIVEVTAEATPDPIVEATVEATPDPKLVPGAMDMGGGTTVFKFIPDILPTTVKILTY